MAVSLFPSPDSTALQSTRPLRKDPRVYYALRVCTVHRTARSPPICVFSNRPSARQEKGTGYCGAGWDATGSDDRSSWRRDQSSKESSNQTQGRSAGP
ncbi:hypothetical protein BDV06DRAFT_81960 [Aspergillus oleicola]